MTRISELKSKALTGDFHHNQLEELFKLYEDALKLIKTINRLGTAGPQEINTISLITTDFIERNDA